MVIPLLVGQQFSQLSIHAFIIGGPQAKLRQKETNSSDFRKPITVLQNPVCGISHTFEKR
jgi:hypothetical protein